MLFTSYIQFFLSLTTTFGTYIKDIIVIFTDLFKWRFNDLKSLEVGSPRIHVSEPSLLEQLSEQRIASHKNIDHNRREDVSLWRALNWGNWFEGTAFEQRADWITWLIFTLWETSHHTIQTSRLDQFPQHCVFRKQNIYFSYFNYISPQYHT